MTFFDHRSLYTSPRTEAQFRETLSKIGRLLREDGETLARLEESVDSLSVFTRDTAEADSDISAGQAVRISSSGHVDLARANAVATADVIGIAVNSRASGSDVEYAYDGIVEVEDWGLTPGTIYYLSANSAGELVTTPDDTSEGSVAVTVIRAITAEKAQVSIGTSVLF